MKEFKGFIVKEGMLNVCLAVIRNEKNQFLAARHARGSRHEGFWEFPGGKLQGGETEEECIIREIYEELAVDIRVIKKLGTFKYPNNIPPLCMHGFLCELQSGHPKALEHDLLLWLKADDLSELNWLSVDYDILNVVKTL